jgi:vancomycin aglycone glucosyltransferase
MRVLLSTYVSRGDVEPMVGLVVRWRPLGAEVRLVAAHLDTVAAAAEECAAPVATGVLPTGVWR